MGAPEPSAQARAIHSIYDALKWGDEWVSAYVAQLEHAAELQARIEHLSDQVFILQTRAVILEAEALLLRYNVAETLSKAA